MQYLSNSHLNDLFFVIFKFLCLANSSQAIFAPANFNFLYEDSLPDYTKKNDRNTNVMYKLIGFILMAYGVLIKPLLCSFHILKIRF